MKLSLFCLAIALAAVDHVTSLSVIAPDENFIPPPLKNDLANLCNRVRCGSSRVCRVVASDACADKRTYKAVCVPCVPKEVDAECNALGYSKAILLTPRKQARRAKPHYCHLHSPKNRVACPEGSRCLSQRVGLFSFEFYGVGTCCYGRMNTVGKAVRNNDPVCSDCWKKCSDREICLEDVGKCARKIYSCQPKQYPGCPRNPYDCNNNYIKSQPACKTEKDCEGYMACCPTTCSKSSFVCHPAIAY